MNSGIFWENFLRVIAVLGLIAVLLLGAWGIIQLAFFIPSLFSSSGSPAQGEHLSVSAPASVTAGQPFALTWQHTGGSGNYSFSISYSCGGNIQVAAPVPTGSFALVPCGQPFNYINASSSMTLVPVLAATSSQGTLNLAVSATKLSTGAITATGNATVSASAPVAPKTAAKPASTSKPKTSSASYSSGTQYVSSGHMTGLYGYSNLSVRILSAASSGGRATVRFEVANNGTNVAAYGWSFNALLPINGQYTYPSGPQRALYPGDYIVYTLNYTGGSGYGYNYNGYQPGCGSGNPYAGYGYTLYYGQPCTPYNYQTCNTYGPCAVPGYASNYPYNNYGYNYGAPVVVSIQVDPYNQIPETTKADNYAQASYYNY